MSPMAPLRPCPVPRCPNLVASGRCPQHQPTDADTSHGWAADTKRVRGRKLQRLRRELFEREPKCRPCAKAGRLVAASIRDHIIPLAEGGTDADDNIQPICKTCSDAKTRSEAARGRRRARSGGYPARPGGV